MTQDIEALIVALLDRAEPVAHWDPGELHNRDGIEAAQALTTLNQQVEALKRGGDELADKLWILRCEARDRLSCEAAEKAINEWRALLNPQPGDDK